MEKVSKTIKYEITVASDRIHGPMINGRSLSVYDDLCRSYMEYAKKFYDTEDVYVSAVATEGRALYHELWGCPPNGEYVVVFHCTANTTTFISDLEKYEEGILFIAKKFKEKYNQSTVTITKISDSEIIYLS